MSTAEVDVSAEDDFDDWRPRHPASETPIISIILIGVGVIATALWAAVLVRVVWSFACVAYSFVLA
jgi:hypothetical protein